MALDPLGGAKKQVRGEVEAEFVFDVLAMGLHGLKAEKQLLGDFAGAQPAPQQLENLHFPIRQMFEAVAGSLLMQLKNLAQDDRGHFAADVKFTG